MTQLSAHMVSDQEFEYLGQARYLGSEVFKLNPC